MRTFLTQKNDLYYSQIDGHDSWICDGDNDHIIRWWNGAWFADNKGFNRPNNFVGWYTTIDQDTTCPPVRTAWDL